MPRWMVRCPSCGHIFTHTQIEASVVTEARRDPFHVLPKPTMPKEGDKRACPKCSKESVYHPAHLSYREE